MQQTRNLKTWLFPILVFLTTFSNGCTKNKESGIIYISVPQAVSPETSLGELAESVEKMQLETKKGTLLGFIKDLKVAGDWLFLVELNKISVFDRQGRFVTTIGHQGDGPGEFRRVSSIALDYDSKLVYVASGMKLLVYSFDNKLLAEKMYRMPIGYVHVLNHQPTIISERIGVKVPGGYANQTQLYRLNQNLDVLDSIPFRTILLDEIAVGGFGVKYYFSEIAEGLFLYKPVFTPENLLRDTLYQVHENRIVPYMKLVFERPQSLNQQGYQTILINNINNAASYIICEYDQDWERMMFLYDKKRSKEYNLKGGLVDDEGDVVLLRPLDLAKDTFYYVKEAKFSNSNVEETNPVIGIVKLK